MCRNVVNLRNIAEERGSREGTSWGASHKIEQEQPLDQSFKYEAQAALFKYPVRTAQ